MSTPSIALIPSGYKEGLLYSQLPINGGGDLTFARTTIANRVNEQGVNEEMAVNVPRLDYSDGGCPSLLLEPSSTNEFIYSNDFTQSDWQKQLSGLGSIPIVTANYAISPDGTQNASRIQFDASTSGSSSDRSRIKFTTTLTDGADYTQSFYLKSTDGTDQKIIFLMDNGQATVITVTSEWQRFEHTITQSGTSAIYGLDLRSSVDSTSDILVYQGQLEELPYATSPIETNGAIETRTQDTVSKSGLENYINSSEGVLYLEVKRLFDYTNIKSDFTLQNSSITSNKVSFRFDDTSNKIQMIVANANGNQCTSSFSNEITTNYNKIAIKWKENDFAIWCNGVEKTTDSSGETPLGLDRIITTNFFAKIKDLRVYTTALTDVELTDLTS